jgi:hypothetical protein
MLTDREARDPSNGVHRWNSSLDGHNVTSLPARIRKEGLQLRLNAFSRCLGTASLQKAYNTWLHINKSVATWSDLERWIQQQLPTIDLVHVQAVQRHRRPQVLRRQHAQRHQGTHSQLAPGPASGWCGHKRRDTIHADVAEPQ